MSPTTGSASRGDRRERDKATRPTRYSQQRAAQIRAEQRLQRARSRRLAAAAGATAILLVTLVAMVVIKSTATDDSGPADRSDAVVAQGPVASATKVPAEVFDEVGKGNMLSEPAALSDQPPLTDAGKPLVLYFGGEYCSYCASQRWPVIVALSRFGTFSDLRLVNVGGGQQILSFHGSSYTSPYVAFQGVEIADLNGTPLDKLTPQQTQVLETINAPPYVPEESAGAIPFMDFGNKHFFLGATYDARLLQGKTLEQIASALYEPDDPIAQGVLGSANMFTTLICQLTQGQPEQVCTSAAAKAYEGEL